MAQLVVTYQTTADAQAFDMGNFAQAGAEMFMFETKTV